jgi:hypothetical protein
MAVAAGGALACAVALALVSCGVWWALRDLAERGFWGLLAALVAAVVAGGAAYVGLAKLLKLEELSVVRQVFRRRRRSRAPHDPDAHDPDAQDPDAAQDDDASGPPPSARPPSA